MIVAVCPKCDYTPVDTQGWAQQSLATDRYHSREELEVIAARVKAGESVEFVSDVIRSG